MHVFFLGLFFSWAVCSSAPNDRDDHRQQFYIEDESIVDQKALKTDSINLTTSEGPVKFFIHFKEEDLTFVKKAIEVLKADTRKVTGYFRHAPKKAIHIFLRNDKTLANGSARVFPRNIIVLYTSPPTGRHYLVNRDDWIRGLIIHELTHIVHMDMTAGVLKGIETVFGTIGKLGGLVPIWFIEGLATWAETKFSEGGRGRNPLLHYEVDQKILTGGPCQSIDCLDDPGIYPHRSTPYWFGWRFLTFLENKREGTLRCFVEVNAGNLPFSLDSTFAECTGKNTEENFQYFLSSLKEQYATRQERPQKTFEKIRLPFRGNGVEFQKGILTKKDLIYYISDDQKRNFINIYDLKLDKHRSFRIKENIFSLLSEHEDDLFFSVLSYRPSMNPRYLKSLRGETVADVDLPRGFDYFFKTRKGRFYFFYEKNRWFFYQMGREFPLKIFEELEDIQSPYLREGKIVFKSVLLQGKSHHSLKEIDLDTYEVRKIISFEQPFTVKGKCDGLLFIGDDEGDFVYNFETLLKIEGERPVALVVQGESSSLWFFEDDPLHVYKSDTNCKEVLSSFSVKNITPSSVSSISSNQESVDGQSYSGLRYLAPTYWFLFFNSGEKESGLDAHTRLSDPLNIHSISLRTNYFTSSRKFGGEVSYQRDWEHFLSFVSYENSRIKQSYTNTSNGTLKRYYSKIEKLYIEFLKIFYLGGWNFTVGAGPEREIIKSDFFPKDRNINYKVRFGLGRRPFLYDSFFQTFSLQTQIFKNENLRGRSYFGGTGRTALSLRPMLNWHFSLEGNYSWLTKKDFYNKTWTGGGVSNSIHKMYSIMNGDAWGNRILTARGTLRWDALHIYRGFNFFPIKLNEIDFYGGMEYLEADRIFNRIILHNKTVNAAFVGVSFQTIFFYRAPLDIDLVYSRLKNEKHIDGNFIFQSAFPF